MFLLDSIDVDIIHNFFYCFAGLILPTISSHKLWGYGPSLNCALLKKREPANGMTSMQQNPPDLTLLPQDIAKRISNCRTACPQLTEAINSKRPDRMQRINSLYKSVLHLLREVGQDRWSTLPGIEQVLQTLTTQFFTAYRELEQDRNSDQTSDKTTNALVFGQYLLELLPTTSSQYSLVSCCVAHCLLITWKETKASERRDLELLKILGSRVIPAVRYCLPSDPNRAWYISTQETYFCIKRNLSARLEDDFCDYEYLSKLNTAVAFAQEAWQVLCNCKAEEHSAAENLGNLYMIRYTHFGRPGDLDDALRFSTIEVVLGSFKTSDYHLKSYHKHAARLSLWSLYEDQPDEIDDSIEYMNRVVQGRIWDVENRQVDQTTGSGYSIALGTFSRIYHRAFLRRRPRAVDARKYLELGAAHCQNACKGTLSLDPGRLNTLEDAARAHLQLYLARQSLSALNEAVQCVTSALSLSADILARRGEKRYQRWIIQALEIGGDVLLARYQRDRDPQDLETAILTLKLTIQGTHGWNPSRSKMVFKLNQALREKLRSINGTRYHRLHSLLRRSSKVKNPDLNIGQLYADTRSDLAINQGPFAPLIRSHGTSIVIDQKPVENCSWASVVSRGAYDRDMQLSTDLPNILTSDITVTSEYIDRLQYRLDPQIDVLFEKLNPDDPETTIIRGRWDKLYCHAAASLHRAEIYQRALVVLIKGGDLETACKLSDLAEPILGHLELFLILPHLYLHNMNQASCLATTIAAVWLHHGRDPWKAIFALESGRELASRDGMNTVRSYGFDRVRELKPLILLIRDQLRGPSELDYGDKTSGDQFAQSSKVLIMVLKDLAHSEACLIPFGQQRCMMEARNGFIIHLLTSELGTYALITTADQIFKIHLPQCPCESLVARAIAFRRAVAKCENQESQKGAANRKLRSLLEWLWKSVNKPIVLFLRLKKSTEYNPKLPCIRWIACGIFSQLPIHAAGVYSGASSDFMDQYAVSFYLSSIRATVAMQNRKPLVPFYQNANRDFTLFGMATSPRVPEGQLADLAVEDEKRRIFASLGPSFTNNAVTDCNIGVARNMMHWARIVHFTCHSLPHPTDPSKSRLVLRRDNVEPCTVAAIRDMEVPNALLLFLSACHSASDPCAGESDEITHVAKAFLLAGFPNVVGTLWQAYQTSALDIAAEFYAYVAREWKVEQEEPRRDCFPRALHWAVWKWRESGNVWKAMDWASWVCFQ